MKLNKKIARVILSASILIAVIFVHNQVWSQALHQDNSGLTTIAQTQTTQTSVKAVESVGMTVSNMDKSVVFYSQVLDFKKIFDVEVLGTQYDRLQGLFGVRMRVVRMQLGSELIELTEYLTPKGKPIPIDSHSNDRWFQHIAIVVSDMDKAYQHLRKYKVQHTSTAPQRLPDWNLAAAGIRAFYFQDPDGHNLEIIYFPPGKGDPKWQRSTNGLFLGIDHTAIVVSQTEASLKFYRNLLGLKLAAESMNYGIEQEHLNHVTGARLHISSLRSSAGLGIEFLEYVTPQDGRDLPVDTRPNDLVHWQTTLVVSDAQTVASLLQMNQSTFISSSVVAIPEQTLGFKKGFLVRDPDGHVMRLVEK
ncbi:VOC family protein [Aerosakkonemataceae cyanobacterium BLCC-F50]|uniref:VOC family protein n=1 Tax=Floridaenema flaviceps BLCC-F50 TaxID=3153642 RepID=A0ABV4XVF3_9CYAN